MAATETERDTTTVELTMGEALNRALDQEQSVALFTRVSTVQAPGGLEVGGIHPDAL